jgi:hypothetical protein
MTRPRAWLATASLADGAAIAFGLVVVCVVAVLSEPIRQSSPRSLDALAGLLLAMAVAALFVRRRFPATVTVAVLGLSVLWYSLGYGSRLIDGPALLAFYTLGTTRPAGAGSPAGRHQAPPGSTRPHEAAEQGGHQGALLDEHPHIALAPCERERLREGRQRTGAVVAGRQGDRSAISTRPVSGTHLPGHS